MALWTKTGVGRVGFEAAGVSAVVSAKTGGGVLGLEAAGVAEVILGEVGLSYGGPAWVSGEEGRFHVKTGRAHLELVASGPATVDVDELARMIDRLRTEDELMLVGVI